MKRLTHHRPHPPIERRALRCSMSPDTITLRPRSSPVRCREAEFNPQFLRTGLAIVGIYEVRKWWNWQTHHLEGVAPKGVGVQIPPSAPETTLGSIV